MLITRTVETIQAHDDSGEDRKEASIVLDLSRATVLDASAAEAISKMQLRLRESGTKIDILWNMSGLDNPAYEEDQTQP